MLESFLSFFFCIVSRKGEKVNGTKIQKRPAVARGAALQSAGLYFSVTGTGSPAPGECLLLHDFQNLHGAGLDADAAGDALGGIGTGGSGSNDHLEGADFGALAAAGAELLVDHVHALGVLGDGTGLADLGALAALDADIGLDSTVLLHDVDAGLIFVEFLVESLGASPDALQTSHTGGTFLYAKFLHDSASFSL